MFPKLILINLELPYWKFPHNLTDRIYHSRRAREFERKRSRERFCERDAVCKRRNGKIVSYQNKHLLQLLPLLRIIHIKDKKVVTYWNHVSNFHFWICDNNFFLKINVFRRYVPLYSWFFSLSQTFFKPTFETMVLNMRTLWTNTYFLTQSIF